MPKLRVLVADPEVSAFSANAGSLVVKVDGKKRFLEVDSEDVESVQALRAIAVEHQLGDIEEIADPDPAPSKGVAAAAPADTAAKEQ